MLYQPGLESVYPVEKLKIFKMQEKNNSYILYIHLKILSQIPAVSWVQWLLNQNG